MQNNITNPLIQSETSDTLHYSVGCLEYLKESLRHFTFEESTETAQRGIGRLLDCISHALKFEGELSEGDNTLLNPLIQPYTDETLQYCAESLAYIKEAANNKFGLNGFPQLVQFGLYAYIECVQEALSFESARAEKDDNLAIHKKAEMLEQALKVSIQENERLLGKHGESPKSNTNE